MVDKPDEHGVRTKKLARAGGGRRRSVGSPSAATVVKAEANLELGFWVVEWASNVHRQ